MNKKEKFMLTEAGLRKLEQELQERKTTKREAIIVALQEARAQGDLSENADYDAARDAQAQNESRVQEIDRILQNYQIIEEDDTDTVGIGKKVVFKVLPNGEEETFEIVGSLEADIFSNKISNESPIALGLDGKSVGDRAIISTPGGDKEVEIIKVEHN